MKVTPDAYYSVLTYRKKPVGLVAVTHDRKFGAVHFELDRAKIHPSAQQFIRSSMGAIAARIEREDVPRRVDLDRLAEKFHGDVRLSVAAPISLLPHSCCRECALGKTFERLWRDQVENG